MSTITNETQLAIIKRFVVNLENSLGINHEKVSFNELWSACPPKAAGVASLQDYMKDASNAISKLFNHAELIGFKVSRNSFFYDDYHNFDIFRNEYTSRYGKQPYVSPPVRWQWLAHHDS